MTQKTRTNIGVGIVMTIFGAAMWGMGYLTGETKEAIRRDQLDILRRQEMLNKWNEKFNS